MPIKGVKIEKKTFRLDVRKKYSYERRYRKVEKTIADQLKESLSSLLRGKRPTVLPVEKKPEEEEKKPAGAPLIPRKLLLQIGGIFALFILLVVGGFLFIQSTVVPAETVSGELYVPGISARVVQSDVFTASEADSWREPYHTAYSKLSIQSSNISSALLSADVYDSAVPSAVYVLRSNMYQAENYYEFFKNLSRGLSAYEVPLNEFGISELNNLPSGSLLVVPSGYIPQELVEGDYPLIYQMMDRGVSIIYIGQPFDKMISTTGSIIPAPPGLLTARDRRLTFTPTQTTPSSEMHLKNPLYQVNGLEGSSVFYNSISALHYKGSYIIFVPQTLDGGWVSGDEAGEDIAGMAVDLPWLKPIASASKQVSLLGDDEVEIFTSTFLGDEKYVRLIMYNSSLGKGFMKVVHVVKKTNGEIYTHGHSIVPGIIGPTTTDLVVDLHEGTEEEKRLFLVIDNLAGEVERESVAGTKVSLNSQPTIMHTFSLLTGDYILNIEDDEGDTYARSYLRVMKVTIAPSLFSYQFDKYAFRVLGDGAPLALDKVTVSVDNGEYGTYTFRGQSVLELDLRDKGHVLPDAEHIFSFTMGDYVVDYAVDKRPSPSIFTDPMFLIVIFVSLVIMGAGIALRRGEKPIYGLDIPDFPPQEMVKIPIKKKTLLGIFDKINEKYKWEHTPIKLSELKSGFKGFLHGGRPVFISDYNLEFLLDSLISMGLMKKEMNYYCPASWEEEAGRSAKYLSMFRKLRDICINNAVPFTPIGKSTISDSILTIMEQEMYVHLHEKPGRMVKNIFKSIEKGLSIVLVEDEAEKEEFYELISSGEEVQSLVKLELGAGSLSVKTAKEFERSIKEMKV